jgi:type IV secretory pathway VirJ component
VQTVPARHAHTRHIHQLGIALAAAAVLPVIAVAGCGSTVANPAAQSAPRVTVTQTVPATPVPAKTTATPAPAKTTAKPAPPAVVININPPASGGNYTYAPNTYVQDIWAAGIVAPADWIVTTGNTLCQAWAAGDSTAYTDQILLAGGIYPYHLATYDAITANDVCPATP